MANLWKLTFESSRAEPLVSTRTEFSLGEFSVFGYEEGCV